MRDDDLPFFEIYKDDFYTNEYNKILLNARNFFAISDEIPFLYEDGINGKEI